MEYPHLADMERRPQRPGNSSKSLRKYQQNSDLTPGVANSPILGLWEAAKDAPTGQRMPSYSRAVQRRRHMQTHTLPHAFSSEPSKQCGSWPLVRSGWAGPGRLAWTCHSFQLGAGTPLAWGVGARTFSVAPSTEKLPTSRHKKVPSLLEGGQVWDRLDLPPSKPSAPLTAGKRFSAEKLQEPGPGASWYGTDPTYSTHS